jgi:hypothetical protein
MMSDLRAAEIRHRVDPGDVPPEKAARRLHLTAERFNELLPKLLARGFPPADPDTGNYDLDAIDQWRKSRNPRLFGLTPLVPASQPEPVKASLNMGERFREAKKRRRHDPAA